MAFDGGTAVVHVVADAASLNASLSTAVRGVGAKISAALKAQMATATSAGAGIGTAISAGATVGAAALAALTIKGISDFQELATEVRTLEKQLGLTAEQASEFHAQATALGLSVDKLSVGFGIFSKNLANGAPALEKYGIEAVRAKDGSVDFGATLEQVRTKFQALAPGVDRTAFAMNVFGRSGKALIPLLSASSEELDKFTQNARDAGLIMSEEDVQAARELGIAQRELGEAFKGLEVSLARAVIPMLTKIVNAFSEVVRAISPLLPALRDLGVAWLAYKTFTFVPVLLNLISAAMLRLAAATGIASLDAAGVSVGALATGVSGFAAAAVPAAAAATLFAGALVAGAAGLALWDPLHLINDDIDEFNKSLMIGSTAVGEGVVHIGAGRIAWQGYAGAVSDVWPALEDTNRHANRIAPTLEHVTTRLGLSKKAWVEFKGAILSSVQVTIGSVKNVGEAFKLTSRQLQNQAHAAVEVAKREHKDLQTIFSDKSLTDGQKRALANLAPDQRHAWVEAGKAGRDQITKDATKTARLNAQTLREVTHAGVAPAKSGGKTIGAQLDAGLITGMREGTGGVSTAAAAVVEEAIAAMKAAAGIASASKRTTVLGEEVVNGLIKGMNKQLGALAKMATKVIDLVTQAMKDKIKDDIGQAQLDLAKGLEKRIKAATNDLDKLVSKFRSFKDSIRSGFDSLGDFGSLISGGVNDYLSALKDWEAAKAAGEEVGNMPEAFDIGGAIQAQVQQAQELAKLLTDAASAGLSKGLLAQFAGQGAGAIPALQELLANPSLIGALNKAQHQIEKAAGDTAETLGEQFFGKAIKHASNHLDNLSDALAKFIDRIQRLLGDKVAPGLQAGVDRLQQQAGGPTNHPPQGGGGSGSKPEITVNVHGWVGNDQDLAKRFRDELLRVGRNNGSTGL